MNIPTRVYDRLIRNSEIDESTGCRISLYSSGSHGYAQIGWTADGKNVVTLAHRAVWIHVNGEIEDGFTIDHICKNKKCIELSHLRVLSNFENGRRTFGKDWPLGFCVNGHSNDFLITQPSGRMRCSKCLAEYGRRYRAKKRASRSNF